MKFIRFFISTLLIGLIASIALIGCGAYIIDSIDLDLNSKSGTVEEYSISPEDFKMEVNGEIATIHDGELSTPSRNFIVPLKGDFKESGEARLTQKTVDQIGLTFHNIALTTGEYSDDGTLWSYKGDAFTVQTISRFPSGKFWGLHIMNGGNKTMQNLLESVNIGDTLEVTGLEGTGHMEMTVNGEVFDREVDGCTHLIITGIKIYRN